MLCRLSLVVALVVALGVVGAVDKYQDALNKYASWKEKHGAKRGERNVANLDRKAVGQGIFVPHRPKNGGLQFLPSTISSHTSLTGLGNDFINKQVIRNTRNNQNFNEVPDYRVPLAGTPLYKKRKSYPYYGRKKRDAERILVRVPRQSGWTLLDPATGRPVENIGLEANVRSPRKPSDPESASESEVAQDLPTLSYTQFKTKTGDIQPIYKFYKKYPFGYSAGGK
eukprot:TRINITY_DN9911_c0_g1_i1.p1 TRINITY_DN9911_c0_g1~~TRINITY_DN9911_c0_g1_i1.p1  ORF type:complete len:226 (-),score=57.94 TRINITY_DN9911_c0_g1_i1:170-847(-)